MTEANDISETLYGEPRLLSYLTQNSELPGGELLKGLKADIDAFAGEAEQFDDITMLSLRYK